MTRWTARLALAGVSAIAAVVSWFHAYAVVRAAGQPDPVAYLVPFLADLVILGASAALLSASQAGHPRPPLPTVSLTVAIAVTVAMNVAAGIAHGVTGALVAGWPALAFILALESLVGMVRRGRSEINTAVFASPADQDAPAEPPPVEVALQRLAGAYSQRSLAAALGVPRSRVAKLAAPPAGVALNGDGAHD